MPEKFRIVEETLDKRSSIRLSHTATNLLYRWRLLMLEAFCAGNIDHLLRAIGDNSHVPVNHTAKKRAHGQRADQALVLFADRAGERLPFRHYQPFAPCPRA